MRRIFFFLPAIVLLDAVLGFASSLFYPRLFVSDPALGWKYRPSLQSVRKFSADGPYEVRTNREGFRDGEFKEGECFRIMLLGDSMTFGLGVAQEKTFPELLEKKIQEEKPGRCVDVMNFGVTGYGTEQERRVLEQYGARYQPAVIFLLLFEANDFDNNFTHLYAGRFMPHYELKDGAWQLRERGNALRAWLTDHSLIFYLIGLKLSTAPGKNFEHPTQAQTTALMKSLLEKISARAAVLKSRFEVLYLAEETENNPLLEEVSRFLGEKELPLHPVPLPAGERLGGGGHWNQAGHARMAKRLYQIVKQADI